MVTLRPGVSIAALVMFTALAHSQYAHDLEIIIGHRVEKHTPVSANRSPQKVSNELSIAALGAIRLYQQHISSQDMPVCNFTPSCSAYGAQSISRYGIFLGSMMIADRLQRCNAMAREYYQLDPVTQLCIDPVSHNVLLK
jgi:putative component of membrane protein insertase Oxa1/YidC/SpoIIIJ protein YidD